MQISQLKGIGEKTQALFEKLHITTTKELIVYYPRAYDYFAKEVSLRELEEGQTNAILATLIPGTFTNKKLGSLSLQSVMARDVNQDAFRIQFFHMPYLKNTLNYEKPYVFRGVIKGKGGAYVMEHPKLYSLEEYEKLRDTLQPLYALTKGLTNRTLQKAVKQALEVEREDLKDDMLAFRNQANRYQETYEFAVTQMHFPDSYTLLAQARDRLVYQEFFLFLLNIRRLQSANKALENPFPMVETAQTKRLLEQLPYHLTKDQEKVLEEITTDLTGPYLMSRLLQGDVGSGKTIIAFLAMLLASSNGYQSAMMAPTEVLATQHYQSFCQMNEQYKLGLSIGLLTGSMRAKEKKQMRERIQNGEISLVLGTHALIQDGVAFNKLALVITDEQHRFGVKQRTHFLNEGLSPHVLVMSATPIPRTLAMILYGDMNLSVIQEMPAGRKPIKNCVVGESYRQKAYTFMEEQIADGHQVYLICPMVEEGELEGVENVTAYTKKLRAALPDTIRIGMLHGKMKPAQKNQVMEDFAQGNYDILVSTTVVEVGVNVPNATVMMVENADRFGLASLHQLRGRVGRGDAQSYCIFMTNTRKKETLERLKILERSNDGFAIASADMKRRGPGDIFGFRQSGESYFELGDIYQDAALLKNAEEDVAQLLAQDPELTLEKHSKLKAYLDRQNQISVDFRSL